MGTVKRGESNLSFSNLVKVAGALGLTLSELLSGIEKRAGQSPKSSAQAGSETLWKK
jgi:hypothetical protein